MLAGPQPGDLHPRRRAAMPGSGRPSKLTPEVVDELERQLLLGNFFDSSCYIAGIRPTTAYGWMQRARNAIRDGLDKSKTEAPFVKFLDKILVAIARAEASDLAVIGLAARRDWKAAAWRLRARNPQRFGQDGVGVQIEDGEVTNADGSTERVTRVTIAGGGGDDLTDDDYATAARVLLKIKREKQAAARATPTEARVIDVPVDEEDV